MKRKRGAGKRKPKKPSVASDVCVDPQYYSDVNEDNAGLNSIVEILAREASAHMSGQYAGLDKPAVNIEIAGSAAAKLPRVIDSSRAKASSDRDALQHDRINEKETKSSRQAPACNKLELDDALSVIKKIMKTNGAMPFNSPVDPITLGIPDYFDIIDTPMDFGTICSNIEKGLEYRNSEDVFKDVQRIWDNCCKYNKEGSYVLELMKRVKNNFMKQWTAAGLYKEEQTVSYGHLPHNPELNADSAMGHVEAMHADPVGSTVCSGAYLERHDFSCLNKMQFQPLSPCCGGMFKPQQVSYQCPCSLHPGQLQHGHHQHGLAPQHNHHTHLHSVDLMNGNLSNQWENKASPNIVHSYQPSPSCCVIGNPQQKTFLHQSSSIQLPTSHLQTGINAHSAGNPQQRTCLHESSSSQLPTPQLQTGINAHSVGNPQQRTCLHESSSIQLPTPQLQTAINAHSAGQNAGDNVHVQAYQPFTNCNPAHQFNQNTSQQLHSSRTEGGRNIGVAGNLDVPPPTESTMNCTKRSTGCSRPSFTDNSSFQQPDQMNSTPEQSSSMINVGTCHPLQPEFSPSEPLHSTSYNNFSKRETHDQGMEQCQEQSSSMNSQESQPDETTSQKTSYLQSQPPPPTADCNMKSKKKSRGRGPARGLNFRVGERISVTINEQGQPVGPEARKLTSFLGVLARNGNFLPLTYLDWRAVPAEVKENLWQEVELRFDIDPICKDSALHSVAKSWRSWKSLLKATRYYPHKTDEERLADRDERVPPDQWAALIAVWNSESVEERSARNRINRSQHKYTHVAGSKSFARIREEQRANRPDGKEPSRAELFILTRTRKNGEPVNAEASQVIRQLHDGAKDKGTPQESNKQSDILSEIIGLDKSGHTRCVELGTSTSDLLKPTHMEARKMVSATNAEIRDMKVKMAAVEQTCAQMASQMAAMMSMMSSMHRNSSDKNVPDTTANSSGATDQSLPQQAPTMPSPAAFSTRQTRSSKSKI